MELTSDGRTKQISTPFCVLPWRRGVGWATCPRLGVDLSRSSQMHKAPPTSPRCSRRVCHRAACQGFPAQWGHPGQSSGEFIQCHQRGRRKLVMGGGPVELYFSARAGARPAQGATVPGWSPCRQDGFPMPPPGEPGKVTLERAAQAGF